MHTIKRRFGYFADCKDSKGQPAMSGAAYLRSILNLAKDAPIAPSALSAINGKFQQWDGGVLNFQAYSLYQLMTNVGGKDAEMMFHMHDDNENNLLSLQEYSSLVKNMALGMDKTANLSDLTSVGYVKHAFGPMQSKEITLQQFLGDLDALKADVWSATFAHFDKKNTGTMTAEEFLFMVFKSCGVDEKKCVNRIKMTLNPKAGSGGITFKDSYDKSFWFAYNRCMNNSDQLLMASKTMQAKFPVCPNGFCNLLRGVLTHNGKGVTREQSDLIFALLDRSGERQISFKDLDGTLKILRRASLRISQEVEGQVPLNMAY
jgi:hypothetical protein